MKIYEVSERTTKLLTNIIKVWEQSVRATHLFLSPKERGKGIGRQLLQYGIHNYEIREVTVNEQNPQAVGFYEHMGFAAYKLTDLDVRKHRIIFEGITYNLVSVDHMNFKKKCLKLKCEKERKK